MDDLRNDLADIKQTLLEAKWSYEIWWELKGNETGPKYHDDIHRYSLFFQSTIFAHLSTLLVCLHRLYENRKDTVNIPKLLNKIYKVNDIKRETLSEIKELETEIQPKWKKVCILRSNVYGHRSASLTPQQTYKMADLCPEEIESLIKNLQNLIQVLYRELYQENPHFEGSALDDTRRLMNDIGHQK